MRLLWIDSTLALNHIVIKYIIILYNNHIVDLHSRYKTYRNNSSFRDFFIIILAHRMEKNKNNWLIKKCVKLEYLNVVNNLVSKTHIRCN